MMYKIERLVGDVWEECSFTDLIIHDLFRCVDVNTSNVVQKENCLVFQAVSMPFTENGMWSINIITHPSITLN